MLLLYKNEQNHMDTLEKLTKKSKLYNPLFVKLDDEGNFVVEWNVILIG